jgi:BlaI family transcriptional regulator, penicillinase repressor
VARPRLSRPTDAELQILAVLWSRGGSTVRELYNELKKIRGSGYNSVLKLVQIMHDKGYVKRDDAVRPQIYYPVLTRHGTHRLLLKDLMDRVFGGSNAEMIGHLLALKKATPQQLAELKAQLEGGGKNRG